MATTRTPRGFILYEGPSLLDGAPIVAIAITSSTNRKTGNMVQTYIMRSDVAPLDALKSGEDASVCGDCKHRPINGGACYVNVAHGPRSVYAAYKRGAYPHALNAYVARDVGDTYGPSIADLGEGRMVRLGTYGDPMAVPSSVWQELVSRALGRTGYTHQWRNGDLSWHRQMEPMRALVMASVDSEEEHAYAQQLGWRTFRIRASANEPMLPREFECPASEEQGKRLTCAQCGACDGTRERDGSLLGRRASVVIIVHGSKASRFAK